MLWGTGRSREECSSAVIGLGCWIGKVHKYRQTTLLRLVILQLGDGACLALWYKAIAPGDDQYDIIDRCELSERDDFGVVAIGANVGHLHHLLVHMSKRPMYLATMSLEIYISRADKNSPHSELRAWCLGTESE